jgi:hypothetical protein
MSDPLNAGGDHGFELTITVCQCRLKRTRQAEPADGSTGPCRARGPDHVKGVSREGRPSNSFARNSRPMRTAKVPERWPGC